ncbi:MAG: calcium-binding protein [Frankiales bacterium]|nr:calcium-binding protein [Frankiales bacterium]
MRAPAVLLLGTVLLGTALPMTAAHAAVPRKYSNCTEYRKVYPHGVGLRTARDKTTGTPVTTFRKDDAEFKRARAYNSDLDRDRDTIACEKR